MDLTQYEWRDGERLVHKETGRVVGVISPSLNHGYYYRDLRRSDPALNSNTEHPRLTDVYYDTREQMRNAVEKYFTDMTAQLEQFRKSFKLTYQPLPPRSWISRTIDRIIQALT